MWFIYNVRNKKWNNFEDLKKAKEFYNETCIDYKNNNCWGLIIQRPANFLNNVVGEM